MTNSISLPAEDNQQALAAEASTPAKITFGSRLKKLVTEPRIVGLDLARGLALIGMLGAHTAAVSVDFDPLHPETWAGIIHGTPSILFALLAGISLALMTGGANIPSSAEISKVRLKIVGRAAIIFAIGVALEMLGTGVMVILCYFGVFYIALLPTLTWRVRKLAVVAASIAVLGPIILGIIRAIIPNAIGSGAELMFTGTYHATTWLPLMMLGMIIGRLNVRRTKTQIGMITGGLIAAVLGYALAAVGIATVPELSGTGYSATSAASTDSTASAVSSDTNGDKATTDTELDSMAESFGLEETDPATVDWSKFVCYDQGAGDLFCVPKDDTVSDADKAESEAGADTTLPDLESGWTGVAEQMPDWNIPNAIGVAALSNGPHSGSTVEMLTSGGIALFVAGLLTLLGRFLRWVLLPLAALGSMPLTMYSLHVVIIFILVGPMGNIASNLAWGLISLGMLITAPLIIGFWGQGPLEKLTAKIATRSASPKPNDP